MKVSCKLVEDLLPLYIDGVCSEDSSMIVKEHITQCAECSDKFKAQMGDVIVEQVDIEKNLESVKPFKKIKLKENISKVIIASMVVLFLIFQFGLSYYNRVQDGKPVDFTDEGLREYVIELNNVMGELKADFPSHVRLNYLGSQQQVPRNYLDSFIKGEIPRGYLSRFTTLRVEIDELIKDPLVNPNDIIGIITAYNKIASIEDIDKFPNLRNVFIDTANITDISPIARHKKLQFASLTNTKIVDLSPLANSPELQALKLNQTTIENLKHLNQISRLQILDLYNNPNLKDFTIKNNNVLTGFQVNNNNLTNFTGRLHLESLENLFYANIHGVSLENITLQNLPNLTGLELSSNGFVNIDEFILANIGSNQLQSIVITGPNSIESLNFVNRIGDLTALQLIGSNLGHAQIPSNTDVSRIQVLILENSNLTSISGLDNLPYLYNLELKDNEIEDISFLFDENDKLIVPTLRYLRLDNNRIPQWQIDKYEPILKRHIESFEMGPQR